MARSMYSEHSHLIPIGFDCHLAKKAIIRIHKSLNPMQNIDDFQYQSLKHSEQLKRAAETKSSRVLSRLNTVSQRRKNNKV